VKALKFNHKLAELIAGGQKNTTWRLFDDKDLSVGDVIKIIDKVDAEDTKTWRIIGQGSIKQIVEKKLGDVTSADMEEAGEVFASKEAMLDTYRGYYGNRVSFDTPVKIVTFDFAPSSGEAPAPAMLLEEARIYTDGGSRGNPGKSACGFVICDQQDKVVEKAGFYLGIATNNQAEYYGFLKALQRAKELGISRIQLFSDSQLVVNQMKGVYKIKNPELAPIYQDVKVVADSFERITFTHVPREFNTLADQEVNKILDAQENQNRPASFRGAK
jgi:ribonuclease HI